MSQTLRARILYGISIFVAMLPWLVAMYFFYWLDSSGTWTSETAHRGKFSVLILGGGMALSFALWSFFARRLRG